jgi:hypothetical protein
MVAHMRGLLGAVGAVGVMAGCTFEHGIMPGSGDAAVIPHDGASDVHGDAPRDDAPVGDAGHDALPPDPQPDAATPASCPASYTLHDPARPASYYRLESASTSWAGAEALCEADGPTSHLIVLDDDAERAWAFARNTSDQWAGISDRISEGTWLPVTDQSIWFAGTAAGNVPPRDCLVIKQADTAADMCSAGHPYLCECDGYTVQPDQF